MTLHMMSTLDMIGYSRLEGSAGDEFSSENSAFWYWGAGLSQGDWVSGHILNARHGRRYKINDLLHTLHPGWSNDDVADYFWIHVETKIGVVVYDGHDTTMTFIWTVNNPNNLTTTNTAYGIGIRIVDPIAGGGASITRIDLTEEKGTTNTVLASYTTNRIGARLDVRLKKTAVGGKKPIEVWVSGVKRIDYDGTANPDNVSAEFSTGWQEYEGEEKDPTNELDVAEWALTDEDGSGGFFDGRIGEVQTFGFQPVCDTSIQDWTKSPTAQKAYRHVDDWADAADVVNDKLTTTTSGKKVLFGVSKDAASPDDIKAVALYAIGPGVADKVNFLTHVDGENENDQLGKRCDKNSAWVIWEKTPDGNPWTVARLDDLFIGLKSNTGLSTELRAFGALVMFDASNITIPTNNADSDNADCDLPEGPAAGFAHAQVLII